MTENTNPSDDYPWDCDCEACVRKQKMILSEQFDKENKVKT